MTKTLGALALSLALAYSGTVQAQSTEERFHDLFITAGYSTAFGAALGAAFLSFTADPASKLRYVAVGASIGFIGGSAFGSYIVFSPMFVENSETTPDMLLSDNRRADFSIRPTYDTDAKSISGLAGSWRIAEF